MIYTRLRSERGTDDAVCTLVHVIVGHLEQPQAYVRVLFVDYSSAYNTIQPQHSTSQNAPHGNQPHTDKMVPLFSH